MQIPPRNAEAAARGFYRERGILGIFVDEWQNGIEERRASRFFKIGL
jgi:hypothetical protein